MVKTFKRIAALALALALVVCFAVSASAINVATTTEYAATTGNVNVTVTVTEGGEGYVTYYATKNSAPVFIDQEELVEGSATIQYQTSETNLKGDVKVGYTSNTGSAENKIIDAYTITYDGGELVIPNKESTASVTIAYTASENMKFGSVTAEPATVNVEATESAGAISVALSDIASDVVLTVHEVAAETPAANVTFIDAAALKVTEENLGETDNNKAAVGNRKLTVIGQFTGTAGEYGIAVSTEAITASNIGDDTKVAKYAALGTNKNGVFAVQLIDEGTDETGAVIASGTDYYVAIYAKVGGAYSIDAGTDTVTVK